MQRTLDAIAQYARAIRGHYVRLFAVATSALRRAENGDEFAQRVSALLGVPLRVLSGEEEAAASYRGALTALDNLRGERAGVLDVGGGSTEYATGDSLQPDKRRVVRNRRGAIDRSRAGARRPRRCGRRRSGRAGARTRARSVKANRRVRPPSSELPSLAGARQRPPRSFAAARRRPSAYRITRADLQRTLERLLKMKLDERKTVPGMRPQRADILPGGIIVLDTALEIVGRDEAVATTADLLLGILLQERDAAGGPAPPMRAASETRRGFRP